MIDCGERVDEVLFMGEVLLINIPGKATSIHFYLNVCKFHILIKMLSIFSFIAFYFCFMVCQTEMNAK